MNIDDLVAMLAEHRWVAACALVIGAIVRVLKSDSPLPEWLHVSKERRPWLAMALGIVAGVLEAIAGGTPWARALAEGLAAALLAIAGHEVVIEKARGGKEIPIPLARKRDDEAPDIPKGSA